MSYSCPRCGQTEPVIKFGTKHNETMKLRCKACVKLFTPRPKFRAMTLEKEAAIEQAMTERISQRGIARRLKGGRQPIRAIRKKGPSVWKSWL